MIRSLDLRGKTIVNNIDLTSTVISGNTIIQNHRFSLSCYGEKFYEGNTVYGFFTEETLTNQVGLDRGEKFIPWIKLDGNFIFLYKNPKQKIIQSTHHMAASFIKKV